jgi:hypothetical protein
MRRYVHQNRSNRYAVSLLDIFVVGLLDVAEDPNPRRERYGRSASNRSAADLV